MAYFALGDRDEAIMCVEPNIDLVFETKISGEVLSKMRRGDLKPNELPAELRTLVEDFKRRDEIIAKVQEKLSAALVEFFDGKEKEAESALEVLSRTSKILLFSVCWP